MSVTTTATSKAGTSAPAQAGKKKRGHLLSRNDKIVLGVMVAIPTLIQAVLVWIPMVLSIGLSFTKWNGLALTDIKSTGLSNYQFVLQEYPPFYPAVEHNILWLLFLGCIGTPLGLFIAVLLDQKIRGSRIYQSFFFVPVMLSLPLVGIIWQLMYDRNEGVINDLIGTAGTEG